MAVTEEVTALIGDTPRAYIVVSYIVSDLLNRYRIHEPKHSDSDVKNN